MLDLEPPQISVLYCCSISTSIFYALILEILPLIRRENVVALWELHKMWVML
jgi:hypothetical protein